jgi:hypothetical protein
MDDFHRIEFEKPDLACPQPEPLHGGGHAFPQPLLRRTQQDPDHCQESSGASDIGVAITDHNEIRGAVEMDRIRDVLSIPGIEVTSGEGSHLLVYFYRHQGAEGLLPGGGASRTWATTA